MTSPPLTPVVSIAARAALIAIDSMVPCFQPVVALHSGVVVGIEALARWPTVHGVDPAEVFALARARGMVSDVDFACRTAALKEARSSRLTDGLTLYLNYEPSGTADAARIEAHLDAIGRDTDVVLEMTERGLDADPSRLRSVVRSARRRGFAIALDDVGSNPDTVKALTVVEPDIIKLDASILRRPRSLRTARVMWAVRRYVAATGAVMLAEGIESNRDRARAVALGATLGQGWLFGAAAAGADVRTRLG
ncbi:MAG: EAL domain-containing protein [Rhodococcus sp. (in: high G+C Gram-positive bacteria)]